MRIRQLGILVAAIVAVSCGADLSKLPPIVISAPPPTVTPQPPKPVPMATVAFHVVDDATGQPIPIAICTFEDETKHQVNDDGYVAIEKELNTYQVKISATDYVTTIRDVVLTGNRQFEVRLVSSKPKPAPEPPPVVVGPPVAEPPKPAPPCSFFMTKDCPAPDTNGWSDDQWKQAFFALLKKHGAPRTYNVQTLNDTRADIEALGAEWQHDSAGGLRPRLYLPTDDPTNPFGRPFDVVGPEGGLWQWIKR